MAPLSALSRRFQDFARLECRGSSPLYECLSQGVAADGQLLALAANTRRSQPAPNLFFAAVHFLLLRGAEHPLAAFYASLGGAWDGREDPCPAFRDFCLQHCEEIVGLISHRIVQTNAVKRCSCLLPAFAYVDRGVAPRPLALVEVGASAGLNLLWDRFSYDYGQGRRCGDGSSPVQLTCSVRGSLEPPLPELLPEVKYRVGIDLLPVEISDPGAVMWLRALVWPEHGERMEILSRAIESPRQDPPEIIQGNAIDVLPDLLRDMPVDCHLCLYHSHTLNQFTVEDRTAFHQVLEQFGKVRDLDVVYMELGKGVGHSVVGLSSHRDGNRADRRLAECDTHGAWIRWLVPETEGVD